MANALLKQSTSRPLRAVPLLCHRMAVYSVTLGSNLFFGVYLWNVIRYNITRHTEACQLIRRLALLAGVSSGSYLRSCRSLHELVGYSTRSFPQIRFTCINLAHATSYHRYRCLSINRLIASPYVVISHYA